MPSPLDAALPSVIGAIIGGSFTALVSWRTLRANQAEERRLRREDNQREAASALVGALTVANYSLIDEAGALRLGPDSETPLTALRREVAVSTPFLNSAGLLDRLKTLLDLFEQSSSVLSSLGLTQVEQAQVGVRLGRDRLQYLTWVIASVQDVAAGSKPPPDGPRPAPPSDVQAQAWKASPVQGLTAAASDRRRLLPWNRRNTQ